ncbi:anti-sigma B factor RsbW [Paenibacillus oryzae]|uniref:Anti-sigma B factor RsbW n=1 Tax=Paenibacillus oryzae TaxID=1844972 RepID=A0A1A5YQZ8_9BACL|nr:anti-sigma B factor RsbW [Paenibacillus oryzae]OBR67994.1 anti-sigma B factor RsbW [Paenibacillus oryzae]
MKQPPILLNIPASADYLDIVRTTLYSVASKSGFPYEDIEDMKVAVTEACTNAILHAYGGSEEGIIEIAFQQCEGGELQITVRDNGKSFPYVPLDPQSATLHDTPLRDAAIGGLGLFMMQALMDEVDVRSGQGTEVVLIKRRSRNEEMV